MGLFLAGTLICAFAPVYAVLLLGRVVQATSGGLIIPLMQTILFAIFPVHKRGTAMGTFGLVISFAPAIGPSLSGWIVDHLPWQTLFFMMLPIAFVAMVVAYFILRDVTERTHPRLDVLSIILSSFGFGGLLFGFGEAGECRLDQRRGPGPPCHRSRHPGLVHPPPAEARPADPRAACAEEPDVAPSTRCWACACSSP